MQSNKSLFRKLIQILLGAFLISGLGTSLALAQKALPASGGNATGNGGSLSYSIGQVAYSANTGTNGSVSEGVQQSYSTITGIERPGINLICKAYPNPADEFVMLKIANYDFKDMSYLIYDISGKLLESRNLSGNETEIALNKFGPAVYILKVICDQKEVKTFKIIKN